jgi:hypothetical protein
MVISTSGTGLGVAGPTGATGIAGPTGATSFPAWTAFTPITYQPFPTVVTTSSNSSYYTQVGKLVIARYNITYNTTGTAGNSIAITLPVTPAATYPAISATSQNCIGSASYYDPGSQFAGVFQYSLTCNIGSNAVPYMFLYGGQSTSGGSWFGQFPAVQIRSGTIFSATVTYESA